MKKLTLLQKFSILSLISLTVINIFLSVIITYSLEQNRLLRAKRLTASIISEEARKELHAAEIAAPKLDDYHDFSEKMKHFTLGPDVERIKIWNKDRVVVWSNNRQQVGQQFKDNEALDDAFKGEISSVISGLKKAENKSEQKQHKRLLELYVPIRFQDNGDIESVIEVYLNLAPLYSEISDQKRKIWVATTSCFVFLYLILFGIVRNASRQIETQIKIISQSEKQLKEYATGLEQKVGERTAELEDANMELQQLNKELLLRRKEADAANRIKSEFLANMSHELRTPLNSIIGFSGVMMDGLTGELTDDQKGYLKDIADSGSHLLSLINDILDLSKVEAGKMELAPEEFNLKGLIEGSLVMFKEKAMKHGIKLKAEVGEGVGKIRADEMKIKQVIFNLLSNAMKFTPDGGSVRVSARKVSVSGFGVLSSAKSEKHSSQLNADSDYVEISVADTGIGISPEDQQRLFRPFQQLETSYTKKYAGTGLGLNLCTKFVDLHGGRIWIESEVGKGSRFVFIIPVRTTGRPESQPVEWDRYVKLMKRFISFHKRKHIQFGLARLVFADQNKAQDYTLIINQISRTLRHHDIPARGADDQSYYILLLASSRQMVQDAVERLGKVLREIDCEADFRVAIYPDDGSSSEELLSAVGGRQKKDC